MARPSRTGRSPSSSARRLVTAARSGSPSRGCPQQALDQTPGHVAFRRDLRVSRTAPSARTDVAREAEVQRRVRRVGRPLRHGGDRRAPLVDDDDVLHGARTLLLVEIISTRCLCFWRRGDGAASRHHVVSSGPPPLGQPRAPRGARRRTAGGAPVRPRRPPVGPGRRRPPGVPGRLPAGARRLPRRTARRALRAPGARGGRRGPVRRRRRRLRRRGLRPVRAGSGRPGGRRPGRRRRPPRPHRLALRRRAGLGAQPAPASPTRSSAPSPGRGGSTAGHRPPPPPDPPRGATGSRVEDVPDAPAPAATLPEPGEAAAKRAARRFWDRHLRRLRRANGTCPPPTPRRRLSPYLKWGCLHPRQLLGPPGRRTASDRRFRDELCWREFYADVLLHDPDSAAAVRGPRPCAPAGRRRAPTPTSGSRPGRRAAPATRSSTPGCASCGPRPGCTTASAWSWPASW